MLKTLENTRLIRIKKNKVKIGDNGRDKVGNIKIFDERVSNNKIGNNKVEEKKNHQRMFKFKRLAKL